MLVLDRIEVDVINEKISVEALVVDDVVFKKVEVGVVNADAVVFEELVVGVVDVVVSEVVGVVVGEDINLTGPLSLRIFSRSLNILPYILITQTSHILKFPLHSSSEHLQ